jgi:hypothetical protein
LLIKFKKEDIVRNSIFLLAAVFLLGASASYAGCEFTEALPVIPDGATATEAEMLATQDAIKTYQDHSNKFMECLAEEGRQAGDTDTPEAEADRVAAHNGAVDAQEKLAADFNEQIRAWKAQSAE